MSQIKIIKASAGSGKTYFLTDTFLKLLMNEPTDYYKSILAVTFTNKATEEMKSRIIKELYNLAGGGLSGYLEPLMQHTGFKEDHVRNKSAAILQQILHGYSWFSIETIDTFFQRVLKAFARELSIPGNYNIELDPEPALKFAVDNLLEEIEEGSEILTWLMEFSEARIEEGKVWDIKNELLSLGHEVFKESFTTISQNVYSSITDREKLVQFKKHLITVVSETEKKLIDFGKAGIKIMNEHGFDPSDFYRGSAGITSFFKKLTEKQPDLSKTVVKMLEGPEEWPSPKSVNKNEVIKVATEQLLPLLNEIILYLNANSSRYFTAKEILKNLYSLGILSDLSEKVKTYCRDNNSFILSDSPVFINRIIDHNEAPFIYEKVGNRYNHYMIDEFQDTSAMQWNNFRPLVSNSLAMGKDCLVVGDVKQSIYRWRNSNWEILANQVLSDFPTEQTQLKSLDKNWRSYKEIVDFNNLVFPAASDLLQDVFLKNIEEGSAIQKENFQSIAELYAETKQLAAIDNNKKGHVILRFFENDKSADETDFFETPLLDDINKLLKSGYSPGDIAILVRQKSEGKAIADLLIRKNTDGFFEQSVQVISNESLFLHSSHSVNILIAAMQYLADPENQINREKLILCNYLTRHCGEKQVSYPDIIYNPTQFPLDKLDKLLPDLLTENINSLLSLPLYELTERLISLFMLDINEDLPNTETPYIHGLLDLVFDFTQNHSSDLSKFIEYWNEDGMKRSISVSEKQNAIQIITIHKSKGLEFKALIIPFCNWKLNQKPGTVLWAKVESDDLAFSPRYPVNYTKGLLKTEFAPYYTQELLKSFVDNLNLLYVATTRAVETLIVYPVYKGSDKKETSISTVGDLLYQTITKSGFPELIKHYREQDKVFELGESVLKDKKDHSKQEQPSITGTSSGQAINRLYCRYLSFDYFSNLTSNAVNPAKHGSVLHNIISEVRTRSEFELSFEKAVFDGLINTDEALELLKHINNCMDNPLVGSWFAEDTEILNESDIILPGGVIKRPDRIAIFDDHMDIIDYKFGSNWQEEAYRLQVEEYISICSQMGYKNIKGYLWYITLNSIVEV